MRWTARVSPNISWRDADVTGAIPKGQSSFSIGRTTLASHVRDSLLSGEQVTATVAAPLRLT